MKQFRLEDRSVYYWLLAKYPSIITIVDGFPETSLVIPSIALEWDIVKAYEFEMGNRDRVRERTFYFDIYAVTKDQRDEIVDDLLDALEEGIPVYDYNAGFPPTVVTQLGALIPMEIDAVNIQVNIDENEKMYYRATVRFLAIFDRK